MSLGHTWDICVSISAWGAETAWRVITVCGPSEHQNHQDTTHASASTR